MARWSDPGTKGRLCPAQTQQQKAYLQVPPGPHRCFLDFETALGVQASWSFPFKLAPRVKQPSVSLRPEPATGVLGFRKECVWTTRVCACVCHEHIGVYMHVCHRWACTHVSVSTSGGLRVQLCVCCLHVCVCSPWGTARGAAVTRTSREGGHQDPHVEAGPALTQPRIMQLRDTGGPRAVTWVF